MDAPAQSCRITGGKAWVVRSGIALMGRKIETPGFKESNKGDDEKLQSTEPQCRLSHLAGGREC